MKQPKVYVKSERKVFDKKKVFDVKEIHFDIDVVAIDDGVNFDYCELDFDEVEFMDNTGFKDENGKYIYVGDIVKDGDDIYTIKRSEVYKILSMSNKKLSIFLDECICKEIEVIGNIYENKELLKC